MRTRIDGVTLFTGEQWFEDGSLHIDGPVVTYAGPRQSAPPFQAERRIDGANRIAMPGLTNAHTHLAMTLLRGVGSDMRLQDWLEKAIFPAEERLTADIVRVGTELGMLEQLRFGVTAFADQYFFMDAVAQAVDRGGMRALLTRGIVGDGSDASRLNENVALFHTYHGAAEGRIRVGLGTHGEYTNSEASLRQQIETARKLGAHIHIHIAETRTELEGCKARHGGRTPVRYLYDLGLLDGPVLAAHCVWVEPEDIAILAARDVSVAHNPLSNLKLASGVMPLVPMLKAGVHVALGTDGTASNNTLNLWEEVRLAAILHKGVSGDPTVVSPAQVLRMATVNGAQAMGFPNVGLLKPGWRADVVLLDAEQPHMVPCADPEAGLVYASQGSDVCMTMVDGRVLYWAGEYLTLDYERILAEARVAARVLAG